MDVHDTLDAALPHLAGGALTIGNFDGLHLGHQRLVARTKALAAASGGPAVALTFWPHPARFLARDYAPALIVPLARRLELLEQAGLDAVVVQPFDAAFAALSAADFTGRLLDRARLKAIVVGYDFTYGKARGGGVQSLRLACEDHGATLEVVPPVTVDGLVASSTKVREFVLAGNVDGARALLGRPFEVEGRVVRGAGRGRTIGVPTANVAPEGSLLPAIGVYAVRAQLPDGTLLDAACNVGVNPTFHPDAAEGPTSRALSVEAHLLDFDRDLYGETLRLLFVARLRAERKFPGVDALVAQIRDDIAQARRLLAPR